MKHSLELRNPSGLWVLSALAALIMGLSFPVRLNDGSMLGEHAHPFVV